MSRVTTKPVEPRSDLPATFRAVPDAGSSGEPTLSDYLAALWRRRFLVTATTVVAALLAALAIPATMHRTRTFQASVRIQVAAANQTQGRAATGATRGGGRFADQAVMATTLDKLGPSARTLTAVQGHDRAAWPSVALTSLSARAVTGTSTTTLTYADEHRVAAVRLLATYAAEWTKAYNARIVSESHRQLAAFQKQADALGARVTTLAARADYERLTSIGKTVSTRTATDLRVASTRYENVLAQVDRVSAAEISRGTPAVVTSTVSSIVIGRPVRRSILLAAGLVLGLLAGIGVAVLAEALRRKVVTPDEVESATGLTVLASVSRRGRARSGITVTARPYGPAAEGYQRARAVLQLQGVGDHIRVLAVLGAEAAAGKSTLAVNLATSLANLGRPVVLVSADLRQPRIDRLFGVTGKPGLADLLEGRTELDPSQLLVRVAKDLSVLPAGAMTANPDELLGRPTFARVLARLSPLGVVIVDTPPGLGSSDAMAVAAAADAAVLVARAGHSSRDALRTLALDLRHNDLSCLGAVLVGAKRPPGNPRPYRYAPPGAPRFPGRWLSRTAPPPVVLDDDMTDLSRT